MRVFTRVFFLLPDSFLFSFMSDAGKYDSCPREHQVQFECVIFSDFVQWSIHSMSTKSGLPFWCSYPATTLHDHSAFAVEKKRAINPSSVQNPMHNNKPTTVQNRRININININAWIRTSIYFAFFFFFVFSHMCYSQGWNMKSREHKAATEWWDRSPSFDPCSPPPVGTRRLKPPLCVLKWKAHRFDINSR